MRFLRTFGKFLISVGVGILLFVAWTLWGTGLVTQQRQNELAEKFEQLPDIEFEPEEDPVTGFEFARLPGSFRPEPGDPVFRLEIPSLDFHKIVVEGVGTEELRSGPGHYPECRDDFLKPLCTEFEEQWPGEKGRVVVSGHRTTYGAPFWDLNKLRPGDEVITETQWGDFTYRVTESAVVDPSSLSIVVDKGKAEIVLTTCNPRFSASQRLIVYAELVTTVAER